MEMPVRTSFKAPFALLFIKCLTKLDMFGYCTVLEQNASFQLEHQFGAEAKRPFTKKIKTFIFPFTSQTKKKHEGGV